jgi:hypothetical protein
MPAQRGAPIGLQRIQTQGRLARAPVPTRNRQLGIRRHDGRMRRQRVRSNLPSGLLMARTKLPVWEQLHREILTSAAKAAVKNNAGTATLKRSATQIQSGISSADDSPGGCLAQPSRGKSPLVSICFSIHSGGMVSRERGRREVTSTLSLAPSLLSWPPQFCRGLLN